MEDLIIEVHKREETGDGACRRLRESGWVPGVVYGGGRESLPIRIEKKPLLEALEQGAGENRVFLLKLIGTDKSRHTMIRDMQIDPVSRRILHIDFQRVLLDAKLRVKVRVELSGIAYGVKNQGGVVDFVSREVEVECLPNLIPQVIEVDLTELRVGDHVAAGQLPLPAGVALLGDPERIIVSVAHARVEAEAAEGGAAAAEGKEPELIKRGKPAEES